MLALEMTVINRYRRWYYESRDRRYRLTLDSEVTFYQVRASGNFFLRKTTDFTSTVLELKYAPEHDDGANRLLSRFPFRMTKSSKYVSGVNSVYLW